jgi:hypothetical protein
MITLFSQKLGNSLLKITTLKVSLARKKQKLLLLSQFTCARGVGFTWLDVLKTSTLEMGSS